MVVAPSIGPALRPLCGSVTERLSGTDGLYGAASPLPEAAGFSVRIAAWDGRLLRKGMRLGWMAARRHLCGRDPSRRAK